MVENPQSQYNSVTCPADRETRYRGIRAQKDLQRCPLIFFILRWRSDGFILLQSMVDFKAGPNTRAFKFWAIIYGCLKSSVFFL